MTTRKYTFEPEIEVVGTVKPTYTIAELDAETGVFSASPEFVRKNCGPIAVSILDQIPQWFYQEANTLGLLVNIDVRIHRLYPGNFPAYPGWHADGDYRKDYHSQPEIDKIPQHHHIVCSVSTDPNGVSNTEFISSPFEASLSPPTKENTFWGQIDQQIRKNPDLEFVTAKDGQLICFNSFTLHRAMATQIRGWRLFFRASMWHKPYLGDGGKISKQETVYIVSEGKGW